jgi:hypothetical protein
MKLPRMVFSVLLSLLVVQGLRASPSSPAISYEQSERNEKNLLKYLWPVLKASGKAGRVYYRGVCGHGTSPWVAFPSIDAEEVTSGKAGLGAVRDIFRNNPSVEVSEDGAGVVDVRIGRVSDAILRTEIATLSLSPLGQYNDEFSLLDIEYTPEVQIAMRRLRIQIPEAPVLNMIVVQPDEKLVHAPALMREITMDRSLDVVATTFKGIVLYGACTQPRRYNLDFVGGIYFDDDWLNR